jgi:flagellin-like protein
MNRTSLRGISPVIATVILVAIAVVLALALVGPFSRMSKTSELVIRYQDSYIFTMGKDAYLVLALSNNDGNLTITKIQVETDNQMITIDGSQLGNKSVIPPRSDVSIDVKLGPQPFGVKNVYKVVVEYSRPDGTTGIAVENVVFKG